MVFKIIKFKKKTKYKPLYKKFIRLYENVQNREKLLEFKKNKWEILINRYKQSLKWYRKYKPKNQNQYTVSKYPNRGTSYKKRYRDTQSILKRVRLMYGDLGKRWVKKHINYLVKKNYKKNVILFLKSFEERLDVVLYRAKFCPSIWNAQQLIIHGKVLVNNKEINSKSYKLQLGDLISIKLEAYGFIEINICYATLWPLVPKHLTVKYRTLQIIFGNIKDTNLSTMFLFNLKLEKILNKFI